MSIIGIRVHTIREQWPGALAIVVALIFWECYAAFIARNSFLLPGPADVLLAFISLAEKGILLTDFEVSMTHFAIGLILALIIGIPIGIAMGWNRRADEFLNPLIEILRPIPPLAWIPFAIIWFGFTPVSAVFVIFMGAVFPILINTYAGFQGVSRIFVEAGRMLGCTKTLDQIRYIAFPAALPARIGRLDGHGRPLAVGEPANLTLVDPAARWTVDPAGMATTGRNSPFRGMELPGQVIATFLRGRPTVLDSKLVEVLA